jgi:hypothetical protein
MKRDTRARAMTGDRNLVLNLLGRCKRSPTGCLLWLGAVNTNGYGVVRSLGENLLVHRVSYAMAKGPIPEGRLVIHSCNVRNCVEPDHLSAADHRANATPPSCAAGRRPSSPPVASSRPAAAPGRASPWPTWPASTACRSRRYTTPCEE